MCSVLLTSLQKLFKSQSSFKSVDLWLCVYGGLKALDYKPDPNYSLYFKWSIKYWTEATINWKPNGGLYNLSLVIIADSPTRPGNITACWCTSTTHKHTQRRKQECEDFEENPFYPWRSELKPCFLEQMHFLRNTTPPEFHFLSTWGKYFRLTFPQTCSSRWYLSEYLICFQLKHDFYGFV